MKKEKNSPEAKTSATRSEQETVLDNGVSKVGNLLKEMRQRKSLKIADIAKKLCIRRCYLEAIEESNYKEIPQFPYGVGFIRSYADFLGLNSSDIIELYKEETKTKQDKDIYVLEPQTEATVPNRKYLIISLIAIAALYTGWHIYNKKNTDVIEDDIVVNENVTIEDSSSDLPLVVEDYSSALTEEETAPTNEQNAKSTSEDAPQITMTEASFDESALTPPQASSVEKVSVNNNVVIKVKEETWIEVKDDTKLYLSKVLMPGDSYTVPEGKGMILSSGKVDGVEVYIKGTLTPVFTNYKKMNVSLDKFLESAAE